MMGRVLIACEFSGTVRETFLSRGYDAWSCDLEPDERGSNRHIRGDVRNILNDGWELLIVAHPPCTRLCKSGLRWLHTPPPGRSLGEMFAELDAGADLFSTLWNAPIDRVAVENPRMHRLAQARIANYVPPAQIVEPWQFGHGETKATGLWLRNLPPLTPTTASSPGSSRLTKQNSIPALPVPLTGKVISLRVMNTCRNMALISSIIATKAGSKCPTNGRLIAASTDGGALLGPGPIRIRSGMRSAAMLFIGASVGGRLDRDNKFA